MRKNTTVCSAQKTGGLFDVPGVDKLATLADKNELVPDIWEGIDLSPCTRAGASGIIFDENSLDQFMDLSQFLTEDSTDFAQVLEADVTEEISMPCLEPLTSLSCLEPLSVPCLETISVPCLETISVPCLETLSVPCLETLSVPCLEPLSVTCHEPIKPTTEGKRKRKSSVIKDHDYVAKKARAVPCKVEDEDEEEEDVAGPSRTLVEKYRERRVKNNVASRRSRETRKQKFVDMESEADKLEEENQRLEEKIIEMERLAKEMKAVLIKCLVEKK